MPSRRHRLETIVPSVVFLFFLFSITLDRAESTFVVNDDLIRQVNENPHATWKAGHNLFSWWSKQEIGQLLRTLPLSNDRESIKFEAKSESSRLRYPDRDVPSQFDARDQWKGCIHPVRNILKCSASYAFAATDVLSDRFCIVSNKTIDVILSPQYLVSCELNSRGCEGGYLPNTWSWLVEQGVVSDACLPYVSGDGHAPDCPSTCKNGSDFQYYRAKSYAIIGRPFRRVETIQEEIMTNGPVQTGFSVYEDFLSYQSGIYKHVTGSLVGGHSAEIVGWGVEQEVEYWIVKNSWGTSWGIDGYFWILRGKDECGIEFDVYAGPPLIA